ncbi:MAG: hypothetical protein INR71_12400, partial [Terriglobus roseus]|nr:hypothetical protein [Terriglobus roseus]
MSAPAGEEDKWRTADEHAAAQDPRPLEPVDAESPVDLKDDDSSVDGLKMGFDEKHPGQIDGDEKALSRTHSRYSKYTEASEADTEAVKTLKPKRTTWERVNPLKWNPPPVPEQRAVSREYGAPFLSMLYFQWIGPLMSVGYKRTLELNDLWLVNPNRRIDVLAAKLNESFHMRHDRGDKRPLVMAIYDLLKFDFIIGGLCQLTSSIVQVISPFVLRYLIAFAGKAYAAQHNGTKQPPIG